MALSIWINSSCYFSPFPIAAIKGCFNSYFVLLRSLGFLRRQQSTKLASWLLPYLSFGGYLFTIHCIACWCFILKKGGYPSASYIATIPNDQMSTFSSYGYFLISYGAIQAGVPTKDFLFMISFVSWIAKPKSAIFTSPFKLSSTLSLFRSLWSCLLEWRESSPLSISRRI